MLLPQCPGMTVDSAYARQIPHRSDAVGRGAEDGSDSVARPPGSVPAIHPPDAAYRERISPRCGNDIPARARAGNSPRARLLVVPVRAEGSRREARWRRLS